MSEPSKSSTAATPATLTTKRALARAGSVALPAGVACLLVGALTGYRGLLDAGWVAAGVGTVWLLCARFSRPEPMRAVHKRYLREFFPAMLGYVVLILMYGVLVPRTGSVATRAVLAILPLLPIVLLIRAMIRVIRDQDELERRIDLEAIAIAAMSTAFGFFSFGLLLSAGIGWKVAPDAVAIWVLPCLFGTFGIAKLFVAWRYRNP
jgi:cadmium resistance protein CadD (predicted permease)